MKRVIRTQRITIAAGALSETITFKKNLKGLIRSLGASICDSAKEFSPTIQINDVGSNKITESMNVEFLRRGEARFNEGFAQIDYDSDGQDLEIIAKLAAVATSDIVIDLILLYDGTIGDAKNIYIRRSGNASCEIA